MKQKRKYQVAIVGATGVVGKEMIRVLEERKFPVAGFLPLASERSAGGSVGFQGGTYTVGLAHPDAFKGVDIALFSAGAEVSRELAPAAVKHGTVVIDNTSAFRMDPEVPLVVPEVNPQDLKKHQGIIANPNCSTAQMVLVLKPIHDVAKIKRVVVSTYQSVSGAGRDAMDELLAQTEAIVQGKPPQREVLPRQIAFSLFPHIDQFLVNGYTKEEMKMADETRKILGDPTIAVSATCVRVPVLIGHSEAINIETEKKISVEEVRDLLRRAPLVKVVDDPETGEYPVPLDVAGIDETLVGRIREDISHPNGIVLWVVADNLRKGAALNAVQIAERLIEDDLI